LLIFSNLYHEQFFVMRRIWHLYTVLLTCSSFVCCALFAQGGYAADGFAHTKDSLLSELKKYTRPDTARANALVRLLDCASFLSEKKQVLPYWQEAIQLGRTLHYKNAEAAALCWMGSFYKSGQQTDSAMIYLDSALLVAGTDKNIWLRRVKGFSHFQKGMIYENQENFYKALNDYFESLRNYDTDDLAKQKILSLRIASVYERLHNDDKALEYYEKTLQLFDAINDSTTATEADGIYTYIANVYFNRNEIAKAGIYLNKLKPAMPDTNETMVTGGYYRLAGKIALKEKKTDSAIFLLREALKYSNYTRQMHIDEIANVSTDVAGLYLEKNDLNNARKYAADALAAARESRHRETLANALVVMGQYYNQSGNFSAAYQALNQATLLNDSVLAANNIKQANALAAFYENDKKEKAIARLETDQRTQAASVKQKKLLNTIFIIIILALLTISATLYLNFNNQHKIKQQKIAELEKEKQLMGVEAMLKGQEEERSRLARDLHDGLGGMLSGIKISFSNMKDNLAMDAASGRTFEKSLNQLDDTIAELRKVAHNLMPEALVKFGLKSAITDFCESMQLSCNTSIICEQFGVERELGNIADVNIYRIIQELVNNAVVHGKAKQVLVQITRTDSKVLITVEDDGRGFTPAAPKKSSGIGLSNIRSRINYFNGSLDIDSTPAEGTIVNIELAA
jgi:two-component system NarL family sensor kinase